MACRYFYNGHGFNSEIELDDFLLANGKLVSKLGDIVFSQTAAQNLVASMLLDIERGSRDLLAKYREWRHSEKMHYNENGEELFEDPPYIGVNRFLSGLKNSDGQLLFPEFREEAYWAKKTAEWREGTFKEDELAIFGVEQGVQITDRDLLKTMRETIENKWKTQAKTGTAIHSVLQVFFTRDRQGNYTFNMPEANLRDYIVSLISAENMRYLTPKAIDDAIKYAKELKQHLERSLGNGEVDSLSFYPEFMVSQLASDIETGDPRTLFGIIDLLVVDKTGHVHIVDYKTSIHDYLDFSMAKNLSYSYQMATYQRMLEVYGLNVNGGRMLVAPIKIDNFRPDGDTYTYDGITYTSPATFIDTSLNTDKMWDNIDQFMPAPYSVSVSSEHLEQSVTDIMSKWFPSYSSTRLVIEEEVIEELKKLSDNGKIEPDENGIYSYKPFGTNERPITALTEADFIKKVTLYKLSLPSKRRRRTQVIKNALKEGIRLETANVNFPTGGRAGSDGSPTWLQDTLRKYCNSSWEVIDNETIESYGLIMLQNVNTGLVDFIRISHKTLDRNYRKGLKSDDAFKNRNGLTGTYESDITQQSKSVSLTKIGGVTLSVQGSLMAEAVNGNIEIMETMLIINQLTGLQGKVVGNIQVINPDMANGMLLSNELAYYCFRELNKHDAVDVNKFETGEIKLASKYELAAGMFKDIMTSGETHEWKDDFANFRNFSSSKSLLDLYIDGSSDEKIEALQKLLGYLLKEENKMRENLGATYTNLMELQLKHVALYNAILVAIAQLKGVNFRQLIQDHDKWLESIFIYKHGVSGSYLDNPGNLSSDTLNLVTKLVTEAYQNTRDDMLRKRAKVQKLVQNLKKSKGFGSIYESTIGNQVSLYSNLYEETPEGDLLFKNPKNVADPAEREFLEYALQEINNARHRDKTLEEIEEMKNSGDPRYYRVPLALGGSDSVASVSGMMEMLKAKLSYLNPKTAFERARKKVEGIYEAEESTDLQLKTSLLYQMTNMFDRGEENPGDRIAKIKEEGILNFERNLETLLLKHMFAFSVKDNVDSVFPMIKAAMVHITMEGAIRNTKFSSDIQYLDEYIRNKILNQSIVDPKRLGVVNWLNKIKSAASKFTLAFAPVQMMYQPLQGLWLDISLMIRKPDGKQSFTFLNFTKATKLVYGDLFTNKPTICSKLNELYGINDMDMNTYVDRISSAKKGLWNFENMMFKFASRPDFYNRMTIFTSLMMGDGCLDAHRLSDDGELIYDWKLDKRFDAFANKRTSDPKYNEQRALYYATAKQFAIEHARNADGSEFKLDMSNPMPLPRAYTNKEAESMKSLSDDIYGYYSHEKKSMIMSTMIGSMWLQFKTYWSGKKNQYLAPGGVRLRGNWKHYEENGEKYYYQVDENGNILYDEPPTTTETVAPVLQWEGQWLEGIILTLADICRTPWNLKSIIDNGKAKWNESDDKLRLAYRSNMKQLGYDLMMFAIIGSLLGALLGDWLDELKDENKQNRDFTTGLGIAAANIAVMSVKNSFLDLNFFDSIGNPVGQWTPFAFEWGGRIMKNWYNVAVGDEDFWDGVVKSSGGLKQIKPALDAIKPDMFRTEREGGTFNKKD